MITQKDLRLILQNPQNLMIQMEVLHQDGTSILDTLQGIVVGGSASIDSSSLVRRTFSITLIPSAYDRDDTKIQEDSLVWINKELRLYLGILDLRTQEYVYYRFGHFVYTNTSATYDLATHQLTLSCSDCMTKLDGSKNGQVGTMTTLMAYQEDEITGEKLQDYVIRNVIASVVSKMGGITHYLIDDIGVHSAMAEYNDDWEQYREHHPEWNKLPYDLEFSSGCSVSSILEKLVGLYPNYEMYFDTDNVFVCKMIPGCYQDKITLENDFIQAILLSESRTLNLASVRNLCEVWGQAIEADFYTQECSLKNHIYHCTLSEYGDRYYQGDLIAVKVPASNSGTTMLQINDLSPIQICDDNTLQKLEENLLQPGSVYVFQIKTTTSATEILPYCILLGQWRAHALHVLTDGTQQENVSFPDGTQTPKFSLEYFRKKYNCETVEFEIIPTSPFTVQKLGEIPDIKTGGEYEKITSDSLALARAKWENWKNSRLTDSITLKTRLVPFLDVNMKISYQHSDSLYAEQYIVKSVSHDFSAGTSTLSLMKFYPLYADFLKDMGTHHVLSTYALDTLAEYTHEQLKTLTRKEDAAYAYYNPFKAGQTTGQ